MKIKVYSAGLNLEACKKMQIEDRGICFPLLCACLQHSQKAASVVKIPDKVSWITPLSVRGGEQGSTKTAGIGESKIHNPMVAESENGSISFGEGNFFSSPEDKSSRKKEKYCSSNFQVWPQSLICTSTKCCFFFLNPY